jgi:hypothetical protein
MDEAGGVYQEKISIGSFANKGDNRSMNCHFRSLMDRKLNMSFSFDPHSLLCSNCPTRGGHPVGEGGGGGGVRQTFVLSDQNFSPVLPCSEGECLKIIRVENGSLAEIVNCFLEVMKGREIPTGSVALLCSVAHLQMRGVAGYMTDLGVEMEKIGSMFRGGVICLPGIPILIGGCSDGTATRSIIEAGRWLAHSGSQHLQDSQKLLSDVINSHGKGGIFITEKFRHPMMLSLSNRFEQRSWVSGGWTTPREVQPFTPESEKNLVQTMIGELNGLFDLDLGSDPSCDRLVKDDKVSRKMLVIGSSHSIRESEALAKKGIEVISVAARGWRPNVTACEDMAANVAEAVKQLSEDDCVVIHCFDNIAFMARSEEGGDLPIRRSLLESIISKATLF